MKFDPRVPLSLLELQKWMGALERRPIRKSGALKIPLFDKKTAREIEKRISPGPHLSAVQRLGIYNQQYWWRLFSLMQDRYPALTRLFGRADFNRILIEPYLLKYPPDDWFLGSLGRRLPLWIEEEYGEEDKLLVLHLAQIEEACYGLFFAPFHPPVKPGEEGERLSLQPSVALFDFDADLFSFRKELIKEEPHHWQAHDFPSIDWSEKRRYFSLHMEEGELRHEEISKAQWILLKAFEKGETLSGALHGLDEAPDIGRWFQQWTARGWLIAGVFPSNRESGTSPRECGASPSRDSSPSRLR